MKRVQLGSIVLESVLEYESEVGLFGGHGRSNTTKRREGATVSFIREKVKGQLPSTLHPLPFTLDPLPLPLLFTLFTLFTLYHLPFTLTLYPYPLPLPLYPLS